MAFYLRGIISVISRGDINQTYFSIAVNLIENENEKYTFQNLPQDFVINKTKRFFDF